MNRSLASIACLSLLLPSLVAVAGDSPQELRHEMMEDVGGAAKTIGAMLKGEAAFDAPEANAALEVWAEAAWDFGKLFPEGSETGFDTEAAPAIWTDRAGFDEQLQQFSEATEAGAAAALSGVHAREIGSGGQFTAEDVIKAGERIYNLERHYNNQAGFREGSDTLPRRLAKRKGVTDPQKAAALQDARPHVGCVR